MHCDKLRRIQKLLINIVMKAGNKPRNLTSQVRTFLGPVTYISIFVINEQFHCYYCYDGGHKYI